MTNPQYLYGDSRPVEVPFNTADATVTFAPGNLLLNSSGNAINMGTSTTVTEFIGAACQTKPAGTSGTATFLFGNSRSGVIRVSTDGVWEYDRSDTIALVVGDVMTTDGSTANTLTKAGAESVSIARVVQAVASGAANNRVKVKLQSRRIPAAATT